MKQFRTALVLVSVMFGYSIGRNSYKPWHTYAVSKSSQSASSAKETSLFSKGDKHKIVESFGYEDEHEWTHSVDHFGVTYGGNTDVFLGYTSDLLYFATYSDEYLIFNPTLFLELNMNLYAEFEFVYASFKFDIDFTGYKFDLLDFASAVNKNRYSQICGGASYASEALASALYLEFGVDECSFGLGGYYNDQTVNCRYEKYRPEEPFWEGELTSLLNLDIALHGDYIEYACINESTNYV